MIAQRFFPIGKNSYRRLSPPLPDHCIVVGSFSACLHERMQFEPLVVLCFSLLLECGELHSLGIACQSVSVISKRNRIHRTFQPDCSGQRHRRELICVPKSDPDQSRKRCPRLARIPVARRFVRRQPQVSAFDDRFRKTRRPHRQRGDH